MVYKRYLNVKNLMVLLYRFIYCSMGILKFLMLKVFFFFGIESFLSFIERLEMRWIREGVEEGGREGIVVIVGRN